MMKKPSAIQSSNNEMRRKRRIFELFRFDLQMIVNDFINLKHASASLDGRVELYVPHILNIKEILLIIIQYQRVTNF